MTIQFEISDYLYKCLKKRIELNAASELDMLVDKGIVLEQEPKTVVAENATSDCISREAVTDCFKKWQPYMATRLWEFEKELKELPSVKPQEPKQGHWVSVRDNLPIFGVDVLICDLDGDVYISYLHTYGGWGYDKYGNKLKNIIAWQPLPKPYSEVEQ